MQEPIGTLATAASQEPTSPTVQFYIPATSSILERRPRILKHGDTFGVFDHYGNVYSGNGSPEGLFHRDTRYLSDLRLLINGRRPLLLSSTVQDNNALLTADLTNPDFFEGQDLLLQRDTIHLFRSKFLWNAGLHERLSVRSFDRAPRLLRLAILFSADFSDIFELRGHTRPLRGERVVHVDRDRVVFEYIGLDKVTRRTTIAFDPSPVEIDDNHAAFDINLRHGDRAIIFSSVTCDEGAASRDPEPGRYYPLFRQARRAIRTVSGRTAAIETSNDVFNEMLWRSMADLSMMVTDTEHGPFPYAGIPWFCTVFGRDAIITAIQTLWIDPAIAKGVLGLLAALQATEVSEEAAAEPGKILHEARFGEMARLGEVPFARYYGSVDSTPLFVLLAGLYFERTGDRETISKIWPSIESALAWMDANSKQSPWGFLTYQGAPGGLTNQGWKDSSDSVFHADGNLATGAIAVCEVQSYLFAARRHASRMAEALGLPDRTRHLQEAADGLAAAFEEAFWCEEIGTYALALDGENRPCKVRSSNAGHLLFAGIAKTEHATRVADQLLSASFFSGWGIRTVAETESRYNPMSYHNGSVWPHDNALIGLGLGRYGLKRHLLKLFNGFFDAASYMDQRRLPELYCGFRRAPGKGPTFYPVACSPQAWASVAPFALLQACLGLEFDSANEIVWFRQPRLPAFLDEVTIRSLAIRDGRLDLLLRRSGSDVSVNVLNRVGSAEIRVVV